MVSLDRDDGALAAAVDGYLALAFQGNGFADYDRALVYPGRQHKARTGLRCVEPWLQRQRAGAEGLIGQV